MPVSLSEKAIISRDFDLPFNVVSTQDSEVPLLTYNPSLPSCYVSSLLSVVTLFLRGPVGSGAFRILGTLRIRMENFLGSSYPQNEEYISV
jgi:hypothetical protein